MCRECGKGETHSKGLCQACYRRAARRERGLKKPGPKVDYAKRERELAEKKAVAEAKREARKKAQREATVCPNGHEFTSENTGWRTDGSKKCKECERLQQAAYRERQKAGKKVYRQDRTHCPKGHELTEKNTRTRVNAYSGRVYRDCRLCQRLRNVQNLYGLSEGKFLQMLEDQHDACAICQRAFGDTRETTPHVDHDHQTGKVRGLLCGGCNKGLGHFRDDPELLKAAVRYLRPSPRIPMPGSALETKMLELGLGCTDSHDGQVHGPHTHA